MSNFGISNTINRIPSLRALTHVTLSVWTAQGKAISKFRKPEGPPLQPHPLGHGISVTSSMCNAVDCCLYATVLRVERCAELVPVYFSIQRATLCRTNFCMLPYSYV